jgi:ABC-type glycerol-3-phosphate transport system substrate-binding protein
LLIAGVPLRKDLSNSPVWTSYPHVGYNINPEAFIDYSQYQVYPPQNVPIAAGGVIQTAIGNAVTAIDLGSETPQQAFNSACAVINAQL